MTDNDKLNLQSLNIPEEKREELLRIFPEVRTEGGQIDFDRLRLALGDMVDTGKERYGLNWPGKAACFKAIQTPSMGTLLPAPEESVNFDTTENLIIEGDNLEALKLLQKSYIGKVKMIYIDPPYNTGNDFIYPDNYSESLQTYLEYTGQTGEEGKRFSSNTDTDGRFHSKWLNMMYPRLYLARDLLRDDGVIFISIDETELPRARMLCEEIFGEENHIAEFVWHNKRGGGNDAKHVAVEHEYVLLVARDVSFLGDLFIPYTQQYLSRYCEQDDESKFYWDTFKRKSGKQYYPIRCPDGSVLEHDDNGNKISWLRSEQRFYDDVKKGDVRILKISSRWSVQFKQRLPEGKKPRSILLDESIWGSKGTNGHGSGEMLSFFGRDVFSNPKPMSLMQHILRFNFDLTDTVLDFFAGSGTTAHAVLDLNKQDGGNRKFILVQLPEPTGRTDYSTIAEITKERVRRVIKKLNDEDGNEKHQDRGFRVFKLAESNFTPWDGSIDQSPEALSRQMEMHIEHVRQGRTDEDILYEILLKSGFPLSIPVETLQVEGKTVYSIHDGIMLVCLDRYLTMPLVQAIVDRLPERVVFLDEGFAGNDALKVNAKEACKLKNIVFKVV